MCILDMNRVVTRLLPVHEAESLHRGRRRVERPSRDRRGAGVDLDASYVSKFLYWVSNSALVAQW
jgi:hypothetical protein